VKTKWKKDKSKPQNLAIHKTVSGEGRQAKMCVWVSDGSTVETLGPGEIFKFLHKRLGEGDVVRATAVNATDATLLALTSQGVKIEYAYWHNTGIPKGLAPEEIAVRYANLPQNVMREFKPREDLAELKSAVRAYWSVVKFFTAATNAVKQEKREEGDVAYIKKTSEEAISEIKKIRKILKAEDGTPIEKAIAKTAAKIHECKLFAELTGVPADGIIATTFAAYSGGFERFWCASALAKYCGLHCNDDGSFPRRRKGQHINWSPKMRLACFYLGEQIIKHRLEPWRSLYDQYRATEREAHMAKHPGCEHPDGHSTARAIRKVVHRIILEFYVRYKGEKWEEGRAARKEKALAVGAA